MLTRAAAAALIEWMTQKMGPKSQHETLRGPNPFSPQAKIHVTCAKVRVPNIKNKKNKSKLAKHCRLCFLIKSHTKTNEISLQKKL